VSKLTKAKNLSLVEDVIRQIEEAILTKTYKPGDKLPSTRELQEILGASLGTIRESLAILEQKGLLEVRKGAKGGFFVCEVTTRPMTESLELLMRHMALTPRELYEFRAYVEAALVRLVVQRASDEEIRGFRSYLDRFAACLNQGKAGWEALIGAEMDLRREFMRVVGNRIYEVVLVPLYDNIFAYADFFLTIDNQKIQVAYDYWLEIIPAIEARDEELAAHLIKKLLFHFMDMMLDYTEKLK
jgi:DNA-binding FadR family transcriptional regulator